MALAEVRERYVTADSIYGTILYTALITSIAGDHGNSIGVLLLALLSALIFWGAHVFAGTVSRHGRRDEEDMPLRLAMRESFYHSAGMLYALVLPSIPLVLGVVGALSYDDSVIGALGVALAVLAVLGFVSLRERRRALLLCVLGGLGCAAFGFVFILLDVIVH